ncbi:tryptophanase [Deinobacterium chartae]|uniref:Tryptophanase n=1 Tax=Deinobacterium chartae TaxID=521158 RepID=A0A841I466_9DEIO|nr:tryptophanase [Deinobacterium chartae]
MNTPFEPYRIKMVEPIRTTTRHERQQALQQVHYNLFRLPAELVMIDLLTDSGTGAMSAEQWAALMRGDESYAGSASWQRLEATARHITGMPYILPAHQGRAAEKVLCQALLQPGQVVLSNTLFDTTRAHIEASGASGVDLPCLEAADPALEAPFKGNMDLSALEEQLRTLGDRVGLVIVTVTNNSGGGQPVSLDNLRAVAEIARQYRVPFFIDACRFAENAYFIQRRAPGQSGRSVADIAREMFDLADGFTFSAKKDGLVNIGGLLGLRDPELMERACAALILNEGFTSYGGLAGRDLEAMSVGLREVLDPDYLRYRIESTGFLAERLHAAGVPVLRPSGGHAVYIDARAFLPHLPPGHFPGQSLAAELYLEGGVRSCEIGTVMFGEHARWDLVRLALPRRVYTVSHLLYVAETVAEVYARRSSLRGYRITEAPQMLRHFSAHFEPIERVAAVRPA